MRRQQTSSPSISRNAPPWSRFKKVSAPVHIPYEATIESTFQNVAPPQVIFLFLFYFIFFEYIYYKATVEHTFQNVSPPQGSASLAIEFAYHEKGNSVKIINTQMCVCVCVCVCVCICMYMCICMYVCMYVCMYRIYIHIYIYIYIYLYRQIYIYIDIDIYIFIQIQIQIQIFIFIYIHILRPKYSTHDFRAVIYLTKKIFLFFISRERLHNIPPL